MQSEKLWRSNCSTAFKFSWKWSLKYLKIHKCSAVLSMAQNIFSIKFYQIMVKNCGSCIYMRRFSSGTKVPTKINGNLKSINIQQTANFSRLKATSELSSTKKPVRPFFQEVIDIMMFWEQKTQCFQTKHQSSNVASFPWIPSPFSKIKPLQRPPSSMQNWSRLPDGRKHLRNAKMIPWSQPICWLWKIKTASLKW